MSEREVAAIVKTPTPVTRDVCGTSSAPFGNVIVGPASAYHSSDPNERARIIVSPRETCKEAPKIHQQLTTHAHKTL